MKINICYLGFSKNDEFKDALIYFLPDKKIEIDNIISIIRKNNSILIENGNITINKNHVTEYLYDYEFTRSVNILKNHNKNMYFLLIENDYEYEYLYSLDPKSFNVNLAIPYNILYTMNNFEVKYITLMEYEIFFSEYNKIDFNTYLRNLKLTNLI